MKASAGNGKYLTRPDRTGLSFSAIYSFSYYMYNATLVVAFNSANPAKTFFTFHDLVPCP